MYKGINDELMKLKLIALYDMYFFVKISKGTGVWNSFLRFRIVKS